MKPILFNTDMVRALLDGRKTCTRRLVKVRPCYPNFYKLHNNTDGAITGPRDRLYAGFYGDSQIFYIDGEKHIDALYYRSPYKPGDILYVRETWRIQAAHRFDADARIMFMAGGPMATIQFPGGRSQSIDRQEYDAFLKKWDRSGWCPSIHMPKEAARIFLRVTDVRVERLQDITEDGARLEGCFHGPLLEDSDFEVPALYSFQSVWDRTIKKSELETYGWDANPWVWVISFERCEKPEEEPK